jgi:hypothetical protein
MVESAFSKLPYKIVLVWLAVVAVCYNLLSVDDSSSQIMYIPPTHLVDAIVFVALGTMAADPMVDYSIASVRMLGKWKGDIYVLTDAPDCFADAVTEYDIRTITVPPANSIIEIKSLKPKLMSFMPPHVSGILYIDVDILVTKNLASFFSDMGTMVYMKQLEINKKNGKIVSKNGPAASVQITPQIQSAIGSVNNVQVKQEEDMLEIDPDFDFAAFLDSKGHFVGFCSGCEKWHSGVRFNMILKYYVYIIF